MFYDDDDDDDNNGNGHPDPVIDAKDIGDDGTMIGEGHDPIEDEVL